MRHIVHIIYRFDTGGLENGVVNLINRLPEGEYKHTIITLKGYNPEFAARITHDQVAFHDLNKRDGNDIRIFWRLFKLLKSIAPDILHTRNTATLETQLVGWLAGVKYRIHGEHGWDVNDMHGTNKKYQALRRFMQRFIHRYVALSKEAYEYLRDTISIDARRIAHICNGVDTQKFSPGTSGVADIPDNFTPKEGLIFGTVGRLAEVKNQHFLLDAFIRLVEKYPDRRENLRLVIVGDGVLMPSLKEKAQNAGVSEQVWFAGNRHDVPELMKLMDVFVLPSLAEGISNTILESMATGLPVIATNVGGNPELISQELQHSHLVDVNEVDQLVKAMTQYVEQASLQANNSQLCRAHCEANFSIESMVGKYHQLYQSEKG